MGEVLWWTGYIILGVLLQGVLPVGDCLLPGLIVSIQAGGQAGQTGGQAGSAVKSLWLAGVFILLQEGMGNLSFGLALIWYGVAVAVFLAGRWLFEARNLVFMSLLGLAYGVLYFILTSVMAQLGELAVDYRRVAADSAWLGLFYPLLWAVTHEAYRIAFPPRVRPV